MRRLSIFSVYNELRYLEPPEGGRPGPAGGVAPAQGAAASPAAGHSWLGPLWQPAQRSTARPRPCPAALWQGCAELLCRHRPAGMQPEHCCCLFACLQPSKLSNQKLLMGRGGEALHLIQLCCCVTFSAIKPLDPHAEQKINSKSQVFLVQRSGSETAEDGSATTLNSAT